MITENSRATDKFIPILVGCCLSLVGIIVSLVFWIYRADASRLADHIIVDQANERRVTALEKDYEQIIIQLQILRVDIQQVKNEMKGAKTDQAETAEMLRERLDQLLKRLN